MATGSLTQLQTRFPGLRTLRESLLMPAIGMMMLLAIWFVTLKLVDSEYETTQQSAVNSTEEGADTFKAQLALNLSIIDETLKVMRYTYELRGNNFSMSDLQDKDVLPPSIIFKIAVADHDGNVIASNAPKSIPASVASFPAFIRFKKAAQDNTQTSTTHISKTRVMPDGTALIQFSIPLRNQDGGFGGIAIVAVEPSYFAAGYDFSRLGENGMLSIISESDNTVLMRRSGSDIRWGDVVAPAWLRFIGKAAASSFANGGNNLFPTLVTPWDHTDRYLAVRKLPGWPLVILTGMSTQEKMAIWRTNRTRYLIRAMIGSMVLVILIGVLTILLHQLHKTEHQHRKAQETYYAASEASPDGFFVLRPVYEGDNNIVDFIIEDTNQRGAELFHASRTELTGKLMRRRFPLTRRNGIFEDMKEVMRTGQPSEVEWNLKERHVPNRWIRRQMVRIADGGIADGGIVAVMQDITERKQNEHRILHMAHHDPLTGLPNRSLLTDRINHALQKGARYNHKITVVFVDLDNFKTINDTMGHNAGDLVLRTVAARMRHSVRSSDTVIRLGGDEFVMVIGHDPDSSETVHQTMDRMHAIIAEPIHIKNRKYEMTCSMGLAIFPSDGSDAETLLRNADAAMYRAKELGRNNHQFFTEDMNVRLRQRTTMVNGLKLALEQNHFQVVYQPQVDLVTGDVTGVEALIRWHHPEHGVISPAEFIPLAEETGIIVSIGKWVLRTACTQAKAWQDAGLPPIMMSVNVSARQFRENNLINDVASALQFSGLSPRYLELELTESVIIQDQKAAVATMHSLNEMGVLLAIDDFGTGFSSLNFLRTFPVHRLKIDKSFVDGVPGDKNSNAIALAVIALGHAMGLDIIAEGVELEAQREFLRDNQCNSMQGYLFSKPVAPEAIVPMLQKQMLAALPPVISL